MPSSLTRPSADQWRALNEYLGTMAGLLRLSDWTFSLMREPPDECSDAAASILITEGRKLANIRMAVNWHESTAAQLRGYITHELLHVHIEGIDTVATKIRTVCGEAAYVPWHGVFIWQLECATDAITDVLAPFLPLPDIPTEPESISTERPPPEAASTEATTEATS